MFRASFRASFTPVETPEFAVLCRLPSGSALFRASALDDWPPRPSHLPFSAEHPVDMRIGPFWDKRGSKFEALGRSHVNVSARGVSKRLEWGRAQASIRPLPFVHPGAFLHISFTIPPQLRGDLGLVSDSPRPEFDGESWPILDLFWAQIRVDFGAKKGAFPAPKLHYR